MLTRTPVESPASQDLMEQLVVELRRIAQTLERIAPPPAAAPDFSEATAFLWKAGARGFAPVQRINAVDLDLLCGVDSQKEALLRNTRMFATGHAANNVLLWGARGTGKSSLVKGVFARVEAEHPGRIVLIEIQRDDLPSLVPMLACLRRLDTRFIVFSDDLSFEADEAAYKSLKAVLDGGLEGRPENVIFYATSNRRHLLSRDMIENERSSAINPSEAVEEKVSLSDRFGLWLGFHAGSQDAYLDMVHRYAAFYRCTVDRDQLLVEALQWAAARGSRSGRVAFQFIQDFIGRDDVAVGPGSAGPEQHG